MQTDRLALISILAVMVAACGDSSTSPHALHVAAVHSLAAGDFSTCVLTSAGAPYCWGDDSAGQLGIGEHPGAPHTAPVAVAGAHTFAALTGSGNLMCALTSSSQSWCWGFISYPPAPTPFRDSVPTAISGGVSLVTLSSGPFHTCGLTSGGDAYCWGQNSYGELGTGDTLAKTTPVLVQGGLKWSAISAGFWHTCALTTSGAPYCWGNPAFGALGDPAVDTLFSQPTPHPVPGGLALASISAGSVYTCGVTTSGTGYCWGNNLIGQLGDGTDTMRLAPVAVAMPSGVALATIFVSRANDILSTTCGLATNGAAYCWGSGGNGQLGSTPPSCSIQFGSSNYPCSFAPLAVSGGLTFATLAVGDLHVCGVTTAGGVDCWGADALGQLGDGSSQDTPVPTPVVGGLHVP